MAVDYRAVARRVILSGADEQNLWLATDNGMILKLQVKHSSRSLVLSTALAPS